MRRPVSVLFQPPKGDTSQSAEPLYSNPPKWGDLETPLYSNPPTYLCIIEWNTSTIPTPCIHWNPSIPNLKRGHLFVHPYLTISQLKAKLKSKWIILHGICSQVLRKAQFLYLHFCCKPSAISHYNFPSNNQKLNHSYQNSNRAFSGPNGKHQIPPKPWSPRLRRLSFDNYYKRSALNNQIKKGLLWKSPNSFTPRQPPPGE